MAVVCGVSMKGPQVVNVIEQFMLLDLNILIVHLIVTPF